jgi:hypothetical protein
MKSRALTPVSFKITVSWEVKPCNQVDFVDVSEERTASISLFNIDSSISDNINLNVNMI